MVYLKLLRMSLHIFLAHAVIESLIYPLLFRAHFDWKARPAAHSTRPPAAPTRPEPASPARARPPSRPIRLMPPHAAPSQASLANVPKGSDLLNVYAVKVWVIVIICLAVLHSHYTHFVRLRQKYLRGLGGGQGGDVHLRSLMVEGIPEGSRSEPRVQKFFDSNYEVREMPMDPRLRRLLLRPLPMPGPHDAEPASHSPAQAEWYAPWHTTPGTVDVRQARGHLRADVEEEPQAAAGPCPRRASSKDQRRSTSWHAGSSRALGCG